MGMADMIMHVYAAESVVLRTEKLIKQGGEKKYENQLAMARVYLYHAINELRTHGEEVVLAFTEGKEQVKLLAGLGILTKGYYPNTKELRRKVAATLIEEGKYCF